MGKARILIVEDDSIVAMDIENRLKNFGYSVAGIANSAEQAIKKVEELKPNLVLMDIVLKGEMDGIEAAQIIRSRFDIPVVFLTAYADEEMFERAKLTNPYGYILKPLQDRNLIINIGLALHTAKIDADRKQAEEDLRDSEKKSGV
jgi:CheY-like chemotaxis protein